MAVVEPMHKSHCFGFEKSVLNINNVSIVVVLYLYFSNLLKITLLYAYSSKYYSLSLILLSLIL
jgi:hypothetical protein